MTLFHCLKHYLFNPAIIIRCNRKNLWLSVPLGSKARHYSAIRINYVPWFKLNPWFDQLVPAFGERKFFFADQPPEVAS